MTTTASTVDHQIIGLKTVLNHGVRSLSRSFGRISALILTSYSGQMMQGSRTQKRFRPNYRPPVVTKYPVPLHVTRAQAPEPHNASPTWNQQPPPYPTPDSVVPSPGHQMWPDQIAQQSNGAYHTSVPTLDSQHQQGVQRRPSAPSYGIMTPGSNSEHHGGQSRGSISEPQATEGSAPVPVTTSRPQSRASNSTDQSVSMASESDAAEDDDEEYLRLDIPDLPNLNCYRGAKAPQLVAAPLPTFSDSDEMVKLTQSDSETILSKYCGPAWLELLEANVRYLSDFQALEDDPIFLTILEDCTKREKSPAELLISQRSATEDHVNEDATSNREHEEPSSLEQRGRDDSTSSRHAVASGEDRAASTALAVVDARDTQKQPRPLDTEALHPATGNLDQLIRNHYSDATPKKGYTETAPPPPPPPPPPSEPYPARGRSEYEGRWHSNNPAQEIAAYGLDGHHSSPVERSSGKRKRDGEESTPRREGRRQRDTTYKRRTAPEVADVFRYVVSQSVDKCSLTRCSRRW